MNYIYDIHGDLLGYVSLHDPPYPYLAVGYDNVYHAAELGWFDTEQQAEARVREWHREP